MSRLFRTLTKLACLLVPTLFVQRADAQDVRANYPSRTITIMNYAAAGGPVDLFARLTADGLQKRLGKSVIVENRTGGAGVVASMALKNARPDGHTLLYGSLTTKIIAPQMREPLPFDSRKDFAPVALTIGYPMLIAVKPSAPIQNVGELIAYAKANPGKLNFGTNGVGAWTHIGMEVFMDRTGAKMTHVPYTGNAPVVQAALAGDIDVALIDTNTAIEHVRVGTLRPIAQFGSRNSSVFPDLPNLKDTIPELRTDFWMGVFAPAGTPREIVELLNGEINSVIHSPEVEKKAEDVFMHTHRATPEEFASLVAKEWDTWGAVIRQKGLITK